MDDNHTTRAPFIAWPGWNHLGFTIAIGLVWSLLFYAVYGGAAHLTGLHSFRLTFDLPFEQHIPFVPGMALAYLALFPAMMLSPFIIRERPAYWNYARVLAIETLIAGACFLVLPARDGFPVPDPQGPLAELFRLADLVNLEHNNVPSLHVAFAVTTARIYASYSGNSPIRATIAALCGLVVISTLLTHQHNLADIITGYLLAHVVCLGGEHRLADRNDHGTPRKDSGPTSPGGDQC